MVFLCVCVCFVNLQLIIFMNYYINSTTILIYNRFFAYSLKLLLYILCIVSFVAQATSKTMSSNRKEKKTCSYVHLLIISLNDMFQIKCYRMRMHCKNSKATMIWFFFWFVWLNFYVQYAIN